MKRKPPLVPTYMQEEAAEFYVMNGWWGDDSTAETIMSPSKMPVAYWSSEGTRGRDNDANNRTETEMGDHQSSK